MVRVRGVRARAPPPGTGSLAVMPQTGLSWAGMRSKSKPMQASVSPMSPVCARHDGAMLGYLLYLLRFQFARERFAVYRRRLRQILDGISAGVALPETQEEFARDFSALFDGVVHALSEKDAGVNEPLFRPFVLACGFLAVAMKMPNQTDERMLRAILEEYEIRYSLLERHAAAVPEIGDETAIDTIMTPALAFLRDLILPLAAEPDTCFVAMPFSQPYDDRYPALYQPMMRRVGYRTLRAWGGLSNEFHFDLLLTLIDKSGAVLAELSGLNPNVLLELGYAYGREKVVLPMADAASPIQLANLYGLAILPYDSSKAEWERELEEKGMGWRILRAMLDVAKHGPAEDVRDPPRASAKRKNRRADRCP
jgi:hypothetical protein